jgi:hypothetical protein
MRRIPLRLLPASLAEAAVVLRNGDGCVLVVNRVPGQLHLPGLALTGWHVAQHQVENFLKELLGVAVPASLVSLEG